MKINFFKKKDSYRVRWSELEQNQKTVEFEFNFEINFPN